LAAARCSPHASTRYHDSLGRDFFLSLIE
jgi:hypothetical protein